MARSLRFQPKSDGAVVDQSHLHVGPEYTAFYARVPSARRRNELFEQTPRQGWRGRRGETRPQSVAGIRGQRELRYEEKTPADLVEIEVHFSVIIAENAISQYFFHETSARLGIIVRPNPDQYQKAVPDGGDNRSFDPDLGFADPLKEADHVIYCSESWKAGIS
jgi:hypothetical protein